MSSQPLRTVKTATGGTLIPFQPGNPGNPGGLTKAEREWRSAVDAELIPLAKDLALAVYKRAMRDAESDRLASGEKNPFGGAGPTYASLFFKLCGLFPRGTDKALIEELVRETLQQAIAAARDRAGSKASEPAVSSGQSERPRDPAKEP